MPDASEQTPWEAHLSALGKGLHDMAQPLTALQFRLYLGTLEENPEALRAVVEESLLECEQVMTWVHRLQIQLEQSRTEQSRDGLKG